MPLYTSPHEPERPPPAPVEPRKQEGRTSDSARQGLQAGIGFGSALAITISWSVYKSVPLAIFHGVLSWVYVVWYLLEGSGTP
jgi:hypothetical protein